MGLYDEGKQKPWHEDPWGAIKRGRGAIHDKVRGATKDSQSTIDQRANLNAQGAAAGSWADESQNNARQQGAMSKEMYDALGDQASGKTSISREMLRQGLQQQYGQQRSMAAGASPSNAAMAARTGAMNMGRASAGMSGQAAIAGMQEQAQARQTQANFLQNWRGQDLGAAQGARGQAVQAYQGINPEKNDVEKYGGAVVGAAGMLMSDERLKTDVTDGGAKAKAITDKLKAFSYKYKNEKYGKGDQFGPMAQDMERAGLGHAVIETSDGKMVHGAKAALSGLALTAALAKRVKKLESGK